jgi:hypothetical protein
MSSEQLADDAFARGARRLTVSEYVGLVASCQAAFQAAVPQLGPECQLAIWKAFRGPVLMPSSGRRTLWTLRRGVLDDLAPRADSLLPADRRWRASPHEQLAFRAVLEALATGRQTLRDIVAFCNEIYPWASLMGVAEYLKGNLEAVARRATLEVVDDQQPRQARLPSWALIGTLLEPLQSSRGFIGANLAAFTAALRSLHAPAGLPTADHARLLARLYRASKGGRLVSVPEVALRELPRDGKGASPPAADDAESEVVSEVETSGLIRRTASRELRWLMLTLAHLPPGQGALPAS